MRRSRKTMWPARRKSGRICVKTRTMSTQKKRRIGGTLLEDMVVAGANEAEAEPEKEATAEKEELPAW